MEALSQREAEVLELVSRHLSNPQIAERLYISVRTVESHIASLIRKLGVADRRALVAYAAQDHFPPVRTLRARTNLPVSRSSFIGRQAEREQLHQRVKAEALVTLTGIGGCGKTRMAVAVASGLEGDFEHGVFFVDLSAVSDPTLVGQAVAGALGLQMLEPNPEALADYFANRQTLLVFDNCEHLLDPCADLADALLGEQCPGLHILATSREPLGLDGERVFRVPSLDIGAEAVALFVDRALSAWPDLRIDSRTEVTIAEICRRVDGIPLAIELAATQAAHLSVGEILERLNDRFRLLVGGRRRIQRQQTLTATLDWSYDLLDPDAQQLLRRLAIFRGPFSLAAAEVVCHPNAMELLRSLVAKSLVDPIDHDEHIRYRLIESVRIYAEGKLVESGESQHFRSAHRDFYLDWIESLPFEKAKGHSPLGGSRRDGSIPGYPPTDAWVEFTRWSVVAPLTTESDNLTAALEWCAQQGRYDLCARIAVRMTRYWYGFFRLGELMAWWGELDAGLPVEDRHHRAMAFLVRSMAAVLAQEPDELNLYSAQVYGLVDPHTWLGVEARYMQANYWSMIDPPKSERLFEEAFELEASMGMRPDPVSSQARYLSRLLRADDSDEARAVLDDWLANSAPTHNMAGVFALYGDTRTALELKSRVPRFPDPVPTAQFSIEFSDAILASALGQFGEAEEHLATLTSLVREFAMPDDETACLLGFAKLALDRGDHPRASRLLAAVDASASLRHTAVGFLFDVFYAHCTGILQVVLDPETARTTQVEGATMSVKEALDGELVRNGTTAGANPAD